ncbi:GNAT family N-acetyltransferase [Deinococcus roseus]|uniref:GNAT family N-acetyltransferase n=1 Tax=Deinococcus roseus TaxID=392414 RepID=A0ABQ2CXQ4_9DEIO|nr:GNAT family N-acetyltransferase [Deinococcus roseus]GGJ31167.1 GNAT family N-acetyltransferase [Deinococcus roseus]
MIQEWNADQIKAHLKDFAVLLRDAVEAGSSIGFVLPLPETEVQEYWTSVCEAVASGSKRLLVALDEGKVVGTVQLNLESRSNGNHRAEVAKLIVLTSHRRRGIGKALLDALEALARKLNRQTLFLDTVLGDGAERLYRFAGYTFVGSIPAYARSTQGVLEANAIYYKLLS